MKTSTTIALISLIFIIIAIYLMAAFYEVSLNFSEWCKETRQMVNVGWLLSLIIGLIVIIAIQTDKNTH